MPLYSYTPELAPLVKSGKKHQTIRTKRKIRPRVGQLAHNYAGGYSAKRQHLGSPVITEVCDIVINEESVVTIDGRRLSLAASAKLAHEDGFSCLAAMGLWFAVNHRLPFEGDLIKWQ